MAFPFSPNRVPMTKSTIQYIIKTGPIEKTNPAEELTPIVRSRNVYFNSRVFLIIPYITY